MMASSSSKTEKEDKPSTEPTAAAAISTVSKPQKRRSNSFGLFLASLFASPAAKKKSHEVVDNKQPSKRWQAIICGIRPLHHLEHDPITPRAVPLPKPVHRTDSFHDVQPAPTSPTMSSRYASAVDLQALDHEDEIDGEGSNTIDLQAEEFIARFYEQMRLEAMEQRVFV